MTNLPQNGAELAALLQAEPTPTRESKVIIGSKTKAEMLADQTAKQQSIANKSQTKVSELNIDENYRLDPISGTSEFLPYLIGMDKFSKQVRKQDEEEAKLREALFESNRDRTLGEVVQDTALSTSKFGVTAGQMALGIADLAGRVIGVDNMGDQLNRASGAMLGQDKLVPKDTIKNIDSNMSTKMQAQQKIVSDRVAAVAEQNKKDIAKLGDNASWWDKFNAQGKEFDENISALIDNPTALSDVALSSALAFTVPAVVGKAAQSYAKKKGMENVDNIAEWGAVAGTAGLEGFSQAFEEKQKVLDMSIEQLAANSPKFLEYADKYGETKAKQMIADAVYTSNLGLMAVASAVAAKRTGAAVLEKDLFTGSNVLEAIAKESIEETAQSAAGNIIQNTTEQRLVDQNQEAMENLGVSVAQGLAGAVVSTGALSGIASAAEVTDKKVTKAVKNAAQKVVNTNILNNSINEAISTGNFENIDKITTHTPEQKAEMLMSSEVLAKATPKQKLAVLNYVDSIIGDLEEVEEPTTKKEIKQAELVSTAKEAKEQVVKEVIEPILGDLDSLTTDDEDVVIKVLGSSANSFTDDDLVNLSSSVSEENKPIIDAVIESRKDIAEIEAARQNKDIIQVNQDVINGGKGFLGLRDYQESFQKAINSGSKDKATKAVEMLNNFTKLQAQKLEDIKFIYQLAQEGVGTLALEKLNEQYRAKYNLPEGNSIHRGSGKLVNTVAMEVKALTSGYKAMGALYKKATGQSPLVLPSMSTSFSVPSGSVKTDSQKTMTQPQVELSASQDKKESLLKEKASIENTISDHQYGIDGIKKSIARKKGNATINQEKGIQNYENAIKKLQTKLNRINSELEQITANEPVVSEVQEEATAQAIVSQRQSQPTAAPETPKATNKKEVKVTKEVRSQVAPVEEAKPVASSEAATATEAVADETVEPIQEAKVEVKPVVLAPKKLTKQRVIDMVYEGLVKPINNVLRKFLDKESVNKKALNDIISEYALRLAKNKDRLGEEGVKERVANFSKGMQDVVDYNVDETNKDNDYREGVTAARENIKFNAGKASVTNRIFNNAIGKFFKVNSKNTLFHTTNQFIARFESLKEYQSLPEESKAVMKNYSDFHYRFVETLYSFAKKPYSLNSVTGKGKNDFVQLFKDESGLFEPSFLTAMSLAAHKWLTESASSLINTDEEHIIDLLGLPEHTVLDPKTIEVFSKLGITRETVADDLGKAVISIMGYSFDDVTEAEEVDMIHSIGLMVIATLQDSNYIETKQMTYFDFINAGLSTSTIERSLSIAESKESSEMFLKGFNDAVRNRVDKKNKDSEYISGVKSIHKKTTYLVPVTKKQAVSSDSSEDKTYYYDGMQDDVHEAMTLMRLERLAEVEPVLKKIFDVEEAQVDPLFTKPTKFVNKIKNTKRKKMSEKQFEAIKIMSQRPWGMSSVANVFMSLGTEAQQKIAGYKTDEEIDLLHVTQRETAKTNNKSIMRTIGYFTDFYNAAGDKDFYLPVFVAVNNRMFYGTNTINPQTNKIIRRLVNLKSNAVKVDLSNKEHEQNFRIALMDAFGIKVNWKNLVEDYQNGNDKLTKFMELPEVELVVQAILDGELYDGSAGQKALLDVVDIVVKEGGTGYHTVQGLIALAQMKQSNFKPFETDLLVEIDGVANGVAILMWQFAGAKPEDFESAMNRAGLYEEGDVTSFTEYAGQGNNDSYQELTKFWNTGLDRIQELLFGNIPAYNDDFLIRVNEDDGMANYKDKFIAEDSLKAVNDLSGNNPQRSYQLLSSLRALIGPLVDENGVITSVGRNLSKSPTMTSSYNAGFDSVMSNISNYVLDNVYAKLEKYPLRDKDGNVIPKNQQILTELSRHINNIYGSNVVNFENDNSNGVSNLEWTIDSIGINAVDHFNTLLRNTYGWSLRASLNKVYGRMLDSRAVASDVARYAYLVFNAIYENTVDRYLEANNKTSLSKSDKNKIMEQLKDVWPVLATQSSKRPEEAILLFKEKTRKVYEKTGNVGKDKEKVQSYTVQQEYSRPLNNNGQTGNKTASVVGKETILAEPGAGTIPVATQSIDAHTMFEFQSKYAALNVHDAIGVPVTMAAFLASEMNNSFQDVAMGNYNIEGELTLVMDKFYQLAKQYKVDKKVWTQFNTIKDNETGLLKVKEGRQRKYSYPEQLLGKIQSNYNESVGIRNSFTPYAVNQYDLVGGAKVNSTEVVTDEEANMLPAQIISEAVNDLGSKPKDNAVEDYSNATTEVLNADNTIDIFDRLKSMGMVEDNTDHTEALRSLLQEVVNKVITPITFVLGEVNSDTRGRYMETLRGTQKIEEAIGNTTYGMSAQEVYVHELVHAVVRNALSSGTVTVKRVTAMFEAVKSLVDAGVITYVDFLPLDQNGKTITNPTAEQQKDAQDRLDYIFNNDGLRVEKIRDPDTGFLTTVKYNASLEEFITFGVTNAAFKNALNREQVTMALKTKLKPERTKTNSNSWVIKNFDSLVNSLLDMVQHMVDRLTDNIFGLKGKPMDEQLVVLVSQLAGATGKHQSKLMAMLDSVTEHRTQATAKLKQWIAAPLIKVAQSNVVKNSRNRVVQTSGRLINSLNNSQAGQWSKALRQVRSRIKVTEDNFAQAIAQEMIGVTSKNRKWHVMLRISNMMIDQLRKHTQTIVRNVLNEQFASNLNEEEKKAITEVVLRTDISVLLGLGYTHEQIQDFIKDESLLKAEIDKLTDAMKNTYKKGEGRWMLSQANNLANIMVFSKNKAPNALLNAHNIARRFGRGKAPNLIDEVAAENELEVLISLKALYLTKPEHKQNFIKILDKEVAAGKTTSENGLTYVLEFHKNYVEESIAVNFKGDKTQVRKGYVKEQYDPNIDIKYGNAHPDTVLAFKKLGYKITEVKIETDSLQNDQQTLWVYVNESAKLATNSAGITSFTGTSSRGADITDKIIMNGVSTNVGLDAYLETKDIEQTMLIRSTLMMGLDDVPETSLIPTFDSNGDVKRYRYEMSLENKRKLFKINENYDDLLSHMQAHIKDKANSEQVNSLVIKTLKEEFDADFTKSPKEFTYVGADSPNPKMRELWFTLPEAMRLEATNTFSGKKGFYVKTRNVRLIFGFRKFTIGELFKRKDALGNANKTMLNLAGNHIHALLNKPFIHNSEEMWQEIVRMAKDTIVVKTGATLVGNIVSNMAVLATEGVAVSDMIKYGLIAWKGAAKYQKDRSKLDRMKLDLVNKTSLTQVEVAKLKREIALTENQISTNPVYELIQAGIYQTIVEDVDMDDNPFSFKTKLEERVDPIAKKIPSTIKDVGKILFMAHDTQLYKAMRNATQVSDFVGRFILHEHNKNKLKMSKESSIDNIVETFVNYDLPTHRSIQYLNDMGFIMFSKFFMRIQKVILRQLSTRLANVIGLLTIQQLLGIDFADIFDGNIFADNIIMGKFASPDDHLDTLLGLHLVNNL